MKEIDAVTVKKTIASLQASLKELRGVKNRLEPDLAILASWCRRILRI
jgi:hypothetical protein